MPKQNDPISTTKPAHPPAKSASGRHAEMKGYGQAVVAAERTVDAESAECARRNNRNQQPRAR